jgi:hypothetical protein
MAHRFDELVKALAGARSRREMLKLIGASFMGTLITAGRPQDVLADNSACALFCNTVFPPGPARGRCKSEAAHGVGLCIACGADPERVCGADGELFCCEEGEICVEVNDGSFLCMTAN